MTNSRYNQVQYRKRTSINDIVLPGMHSLVIVEQQFCSEVDAHVSDVLWWLLSRTPPSLHVFQRLQAHIPEQS